MRAEERNDTSRMVQGVSTAEMDTEHAGATRKWDSCEMQMMGTTATQWMPTGHDSGCRFTTCLLVAEA